MCEQHHLLILLNSFPYNTKTLVLIQYVNPKVRIMFPLLEV